MTIAIACLLVAALMPFLTIAPAKYHRSYDNHAPREYLAQVEGWPDTHASKVFEHDIATQDCLYIGMGTKAVTFASSDASKPAKFYMMSCPAHQTYPTTKAATNRLVVFMQRRTLRAGER